MNTFSETKPSNPQCKHCNDTGSTSEAYKRNNRDKRPRRRLVTCPACKGTRKDGTTQNKTGIVPIEVSQKSPTETPDGRTPDILPQNTDLVQPLTGEPPANEPWPGFNEGQEPSPERPSAQGQTANQPKEGEADTQNSGLLPPQPGHHTAGKSAAQDSTSHSTSEPAPETDRGPLPNLA